MIISLFRTSKYLGITGWRIAGYLVEKAWGIQQEKKLHQELVSLLGELNLRIRVNKSLMNDEDMTSKTLAVSKRVLELEEQLENEQALFTKIHLQLKSEDDPREIARLKKRLDPIENRVKQLQKTNEELKKDHSEIVRVSEPVYEVSHLYSRRTDIKYNLRKLQIRRAFIVFETLITILFIADELVIPDTFKVSANFFEAVIQLIPLLLITIYLSDTYDDGSDIMSFLKIFVLTASINGLVISLVALAFDQNGFSPASGAALAVLTLLCGLIATIVIKHSTRSS